MEQDLAVPLSEASGLVVTRFPRLWIVDCAALGTLLNYWNNFNQPLLHSCKGLSRPQSAGKPINPVKPIATTLPGLVRAGRKLFQGVTTLPGNNVPLTGGFCKSSNQQFKIRPFVWISLFFAWSLLL